VVPDEVGDLPGDCSRLVQAVKELARPLGADRWPSCQDSQPAPTASTSQVIGSSRKPL
jgi:hypothetical protein